MACLLGIDIGTSGTKSLLIDETGKVLGSASVDHSISSPKPLWSEQQPEEWWSATVESVKKVLAASGVKGSEVKGIGLSGQMHGLVLLDSGDNVLRPAILWNDQRTAEECAEIESAAGGRAKLIEMVSNPALTGFTAPKILWVRKNEPEVFEKAVKALLPKDYIRFRLTGEFMTEVSDASGTLLLDVNKRKWCDKLISLLDIDKSLLPKCVESPEVTGKLTGAAAEATGLAAGIPVVGGGGDQAAGAVGNGIVRQGVLSATMGTSGVVFACQNEPRTDPQGRLHTFCHAVPDMWFMMGVVLAAGGSFQWFRNNLGSEERAEAEAKKCDPYEILTAEAAEAPPGCEGLTFLPYLTGERTPHADPYARGAFVGITMRTRKAEMIRSVMEGATFAMRDSLEIIREMGVSVEEIRVSGGGARSELWRHMQADIYKQSVTRVTVEEGPAFGVAILAGVGTGVWKSVPEACEAVIKTTGLEKADPDNVAAYDRTYAVYRDLYPALKKEFRKMAE